MTTIESIIIGLVSGLSSALTMVMLMKLRMMPLLAIYVPKEQYEKMTHED